MTLKNTQNEKNEYPRYEVLYGIFHVRILYFRIFFEGFELILRLFCIKSASSLRLYDMYSNGYGSDEALLVRNNSFSFCFSDSTEVKSIFIRKDNDFAYYSILLHVQDYALTPNRNDCESFAHFLHVNLLCCFFGTVPRNICILYVLKGILHFHNSTMSIC